MLLELETQTKQLNKLEEFAIAARQRISENWDLVIGVTGEEGAGKSSLAIELGSAIDPSFSLSKNILYDPDTTVLTNLVYTLPHGSPIIVDEAIKVMYKHKFYEEAQNFLNEVYAVCRKQRKISILCMPRFFDFNEFFRNHRIRLWVHIYERGKAVVFLRDDVNPFSTDPWHVKENLRKIDKKLRRRVFGLEDWEKLSAYQSISNYFTHFYFNQLPEPVEAEYKHRCELFSATQEKRRIVLTSEMMAALSQKAIGSFVSMAEMREKYPLKRHELRAFMESKGLFPIRHKEGYGVKITPEFISESLLQAARSSPSPSLSPPESSDDQPG